MLFVCFNYKCSRIANFLLCTSVRHLPHSSLSLYVPPQQQLFNITWECSASERKVCDPGRPMLTSVCQKELVPEFAEEMVIVFAYPNLGWTQEYPVRRLQNVFEWLQPVSIDGARERRTALWWGGRTALEGVLSAFFSFHCYFPSLAGGIADWELPTLTFCRNIPFCEVSNLLTLSHY